MKVIPVLQMVVIKDIKGQLGVVFPSEIHELDNSQTSNFFIGVPRGIKNIYMLQSYLKKAKLLMPFLSDGETVNINATIDFPVVKFRISNYAVGEKALSFIIDTIDNQFDNRIRPSALVKFSRNAIKIMRYYRRNFGEGFVKVKYRGGSSLINANMNFILIKPMDASRYSGLYLKNRFLPVGATPKFGYNLLKIYSLNENGEDQDNYQVDI